MGWEGGRMSRIGQVTWNSSVIHCFTYCPLFTIILWASWGYRSCLFCSSLYIQNLAQCLSHSMHSINICWIEWIVKKCYTTVKLSGPKNTVACHQRYSAIPSHFTQLLSPEFGDLQRKWPTTVPTQRKRSFNMVYHWLIDNVYSPAAKRRQFYKEDSRSWCSLSPADRAP